MRCVLVLAAPLTLAACVANMDSEVQTDEDENIGEVEQAMVPESPYPSPGGPAPGGHDMGGPGGGWQGGMCNDPQYAPLCRPRDPDPGKAHRTAQQREYDRIGAANEAQRRKGEAIDAKRRIAARGEVIQRAFEEKRGKGIETDRAACRYACTSTGRDMCLEVLRACQMATPLYFVPEIPISCGVAVPAVCGGRTPLCYVACMVFK